MAIERVSGGKKGIEDYLGKGIKAGDQLGDKYLHYTLNFKEEDISFGKVEEASEIFRKFFLAANLLGREDFFKE